MTGSVDPIFVPIQGERNVQMRQKIVMVVLAITIPAGTLLATQTMASAGRHASTVKGTGTLSCATVVGNIKLTPGWKTNSNNLPAPSKATFNLAFDRCSATSGNITTRVFNGHLRGSVAFPTNDCTSNFGGLVTLHAGPAVSINWGKAARIGPVIPAPTSIALAHVTGTFTAGVGIKFTFSHQVVTGSFSTKTVSGEFDSYLDACSPNTGTRNIPIDTGTLSQP